MAAAEPILVLNVGSSTVKAAVFQGGERVHSWIGPSGGDPAERIGALLEIVDEPVAVVGHRLVHGGTTFTTPTRITPDVLSALDALAPFAPLHLPPEVAAIRAVENLLPGMAQVACFDTAFHATQPELESWYGLPQQYHEAGVRKYGFHGLSYHFIASRLPDVSPRAASGKTVVCHLGSGASVCGMTVGKSVSTSMGFSPLDGLLMSTRCGRIDPGVLLYLLKHEGMTADQVEQLLSRESGLLGVSGISGDMRELLRSESAEAAFAVELFCDRAAKEIAATAVALGGLDAVVFTAGIGENCPPVRTGIARRLGWLGLELDETANEENATTLHTAGSRIEAYTIPTDEERVIAEAVARDREIGSGEVPAR